MPIWSSSRSAAVSSSVPTTPPSLLALFQRIEPRFVGPGDQLQRVDVIGPAEADGLDAVGRDLHAVHGEIEVAPLQARNQALEVVLDELDAAAEFLLQGLGQIDLEADVAVGVLGVLADVGGAAFGVGGPAQRRLRRSVGASPPGPPAQRERSQPEQTPARRTMCFTRLVNAVTDLDRHLILLNLAVGDAAAVFHDLEPTHVRKSSPALATALATASSKDLVDVPTNSLFPIHGVRHEMVLFP